MSGISKMSKSKSSKNFNHMTRKNLRKIDTLLKNKPSLNGKFKYGKNRPSNNSYNSLSYWKERNSMHDKRVKMMRKSKGFDKDR